MPVFTPGRHPAYEPIGRLRSNPFHGGKKSGHSDLNLVPMVDMLTVVVIFLLQSFSGDGEVSVHKNLTLPDSEQAKPLSERGPIIVVNHGEVLLDGDVIATLDDENADAPGIEALTERLTAVKEQNEKVEEELRKRDPSRPVKPFDGNLIVQADDETDFKLVRRAIFSANAAGWTHLQFAVTKVLPEGAGGGGGHEGWETPDRTGFAPDLIAIAAAFPALVWLVWSAAAHSFVCDDAYISFRYARNLLEGHGLVFNPGEAVEGYTNFAWVLEVAALWSVGLDPASGSIVLSALWTVVTVVATGALAWRLARPHTSVPLFAALVLVATERSMAVWATSGLETRQFTGLVVLALLAVTFEGTTAAAAASLALALAALTRPEALLLFALIGGLRGLDWLRTERRWTEIAALTAPFGIVVGAHLLWRHHVYGMWVPNTYVAKATAPWFELGWPYLGCASIEAGLYLIGPLALVGFGRRAWLDRRLAWLAGPVCIAVFVPWLARLGGDHFEWRPLDWWWAPLSAGAAYGLVVIARRGWAAVLLLALILPYARVVELEHDRLASRRDVDSKGSSHEPITRNRAPEAFYLPGMGPLLDWYNPALAEVIGHFSAVRHWRHASFAERERERYGPYLPQRKEIRRRLPPDLVWARGSIGIAPFHVPDVEVIDILGLTDATIAATPPPENMRRMLAHERRPPPGYLDERGADAQIEPVAPDLHAALRHAEVVLPLTADIVMPISSKSGRSLLPLFRESGVPLPTYRRTDAQQPGGNELRTDQARWVGARVVAAFDEGLNGWVADGDAFELRKSSSGLDRLRNRVGPGFVASVGPDGDQSATGTLTSPSFSIPEGGLLSMLVGGGEGDATAVRVLVDEREVAVFHGDGDDDLAWVWVDLAEWAGRQARVVAVDEDPRAHVTLDHVVLMRRR